MAGSEAGRTMGRELSTSFFFQYIVGNGKEKRKERSCSVSDHQVCHSAPLSHKPAGLPAPVPNEQPIDVTAAMKMPGSRAAPLALHP